MGFGSEEHFRSVTLHQDGGVGATSLIAGMCEEVGLVDIIDRNLHGTRRGGALSPGKLIEGLIICILSDRKALYRVEEFREERI